MGLGERKTIVWRGLGCNPIGVTSCELRVAGLRVECRAHRTRNPQPATRNPQLVTWGREARMGRRGGASEPKNHWRNPIYRFRRASRQADKSNRGRRNTAAASPMASGVGPIKSQNRGWSALAAAIVPENRRVSVKLKELMSDSFADRSVFRRSPRTLHWRVNSRDSHGRSVTLFCWWAPEASSISTRLGPRRPSNTWINRCFACRVSICRLVYGWFMSSPLFVHSIIRRTRPRDLDIGRKKSLSFARRRAQSAE